MKKLLKLIIASIVLMTFNSFAQILNNDFENWNGTEPEYWATTNLMNYSYPVTKSTDSFSGSFALKGDICYSPDGDLMLPLITYTPDSTLLTEIAQSNSLNFYYKFSPVEDDQLVCAVFLYNDIQLVGAGMLQIFEASDTYTMASVPIQYFEEGKANICLIVIGAGNEDEVIGGHTGTWFLVDEISFSGTTAIDDEVDAPNNFVLEQNYPNPFNPSTTIKFNLPISEIVTLKIYNSIGQEVAVLIDNEFLNSGLHSFVWNADNFSNGVYFYSLSSGKYIQTNKMTLLK